MPAPIMMTVLDRPATDAELAAFAQHLADGYLDGQPIPAKYGQLWERVAERPRANMGPTRFIAWKLITRAKGRLFAPKALAPVVPGGERALSPDASGVFMAGERIK